MFNTYVAILLQVLMDTLDKLHRLVKALSSKKDVDKSTAFKNIVNFLVNTNAMLNAEKELSALNKNEVTAEKFMLTDDEFSDLKKKTGKTKDSNFLLTLFQKSICKLVNLMLIEIEKDVNENRFEDVILPLLVLFANLPLKYLPENDPFGTRINFGANDSFNKDKSFLYAPKSYKSFLISPSSSVPITRPFLIPILQFVIKSDRYITSERLKDVPFLVQCLRFAVHYEDSELEVLRFSFWELAVKVIKAVDLLKTRDSTAIFDQLNALAWNDNGDDCTKAVWRCVGPSERKTLVMPREEVYACIALLRGMNRRVPLNVHLKSCLRDVIKTLMKSISYRKSSEDCINLLKLLNSWISKGKESPIDVQLVRMMIRDVMESYDSFLAKCPFESMGSNTKYLLSLAQESLAVNNNLKSVKSSLESLFDRINITISKSGKDGQNSLLEYVKFLTEFLEDWDVDSPLETKDTPWYILFRAVFVRCSVVKMKMEWMEKTDVLTPLYKKMSGLLKVVTEELQQNMSCDYMNECIPILTEVISILINSKMENDKHWECIIGLCDSQIPSTVIKSISLMKNQSAKTQCSSLISKMIERLTVIINDYPPKTTLSHFESFFTDALTVDLPPEIRESICTLWKQWYGTRLEELSGVSISEELMGRLKWFNLPIPPNSINDKFEVKLEETGGSPKKSSSASSTLKKGSLFSSPGPLKKAKNANDALKMIDLMDEDSVQFFPVESPKKKQRMTEKQKEMMMEKKDRLPFMEDESTTGIPKIPSDIFELSMSCAEGSKSIGSKKGQMKTDFSDLNGEKKSDEKEVKEGLNVTTEKERASKRMKVDDNIEESASSSSESMNEEEEKKGGRRKSKTPMKMVMKTREERSPSRKKMEATMSAVNSPRRKSRRLGIIEENEKKEEEKSEKKTGKEGERKEKKKEKVEDEEEKIEKMEGEEKSDEKVMEEEEEKEESVVMVLMKEGVPSDEKKSSIPKREEKIIILSPESSVVCRDDSLPTSQFVNEDSSPIKSMDGEGGMAVPSTPANRGSFEPVGILSSSKKNKSEKKKGGVHFNISDEMKIEVIAEEEDRKEKKEERKEKKEEGGMEDKTEKMVFALLRDNEDSIDTIILKLGLNSRMIKKSLETIGVKTVGQLASLSAKEINGVMGIKPPKMQTVQKELKGLLARNEKPSSQPLPPIFTPEKKKEDAVVSPKITEAPLPSIDLSPLTKHPSPPKSKSRKRLALSDSPIRVKKSKGEEEEKKDEEVKEKEEEKIEELMEVEIIGEGKDYNVGEQKEIAATEKKSDEIEKKEDKIEVMEINEEKENKENEEKREEEEKEKSSIASVQDVISFISHLKESSLQSFLDAHEKITLSLMDALRDVRNAQPSS